MRGRQIVSLKDINPWLVVLTALIAPYVTEWAKARFGRRTQKLDETHKSHDQLQEDLAAERTKIENLETRLAKSQAIEDGYRESMRTLVESALHDVLKGSLTGTNRNDTKQPPNI